jgi:hypothetical protein
MIVTPFGDVEYGNVQSILYWLDAHDVRHHTERQALIEKHSISLSAFPMTGPVNSEWFGRHALAHLAYAPFGRPNASVARLDLEHQWDSPANFYHWHQVHNESHETDGNAILFDPAVGGSVALGFPSTKSLVNAYSTGGYTPTTNGNLFVDDAFQFTSGALTANTLATLLNLTGAGVLSQFSMGSNDGVSRTMRVQATVDGTIVFDSTSAAFTTTPGFMLLAGSALRTTATISQLGENAIYWNSSLVIKIASSLTETGKFTGSYKYTTY